MARNLITASFAGSTPRRAEHLTPNGQAVKALDCRLSDGSLDSWREPRQIDTVPANTKSVYQAFNCCWLQSTKCASWAEGSVDQRHVFATQYNEFDYPVRIVLGEMCEPTVLRLGLPCPAERIVATAAATFNKGSAPRQYLFQFEDSLGNLSAASEPSDAVVVQEGASVQLSGWAVPTGGWDIQKIRIYRSVAGTETTPFQESGNKIDSAWMLVDTIPASQASYTDSKFDADLIDALAEDEVEPPPAGLRGMTWIRTMNCLAGFVGRELFFTENNNYHNWAYKIKLDDTVKALCEVNDRIYVATDGAPYMVPAAVNCENAGCRQAVRMPESLPLVGGGFRSMIALPSGAIYPTHSGLVYMSGNRAPAILTAKHYAPEDWQALHPDTAKLGYHEGLVFAFFRKGAFCLAVQDGAGTAAETEQHTELSLRPDEVFTSRLGRLYLRFGTDVKEWNRGVAKMPHRYESGESLAGVPFNFGAAQVLMELGTETVQVFVDGDEALNETIFKNEHFPLPMWATGQEWRWVLTGTANVKMVGLAPSTKEL
jgi:hypothetical protein